MLFFLAQQEEGCGRHAASRFTQSVLAGSSACNYAVVPYQEVYGLRRWNSGKPALLHHSHIAVVVLQWWTL